MLADCYECGKEISSKASRCVRCGYYYAETTSYEAKVEGGYVRHCAGYEIPVPPRPADFNDYFWSIVGSIFLGVVWSLVPLIAMPVLAVVSLDFRSSILWAAYPSPWLIAATGLLGFVYGLYIYVYKLCMKL